MAKNFDFVSHCEFYGVLCWNPIEHMYNLWHVFAYGNLEDAKSAARVRDGIVVHWFWPSSAEKRLDSFRLVNDDDFSDLPF